MYACSSNAVVQVPRRAEMSGPLMLRLQMVATFSTHSFHVGYMELNSNSVEQQKLNELSNALSDDGIYF